MPVPVIAVAYRTSFGRAGGVLEDVRNESLSITLIDHILDEHDVNPDDVEDLIWGATQQRARQDNNVARAVTLLSVLSEGTLATNISRWCASLMQVIVSALDVIAAGNCKRIAAGGVENMSHVPMGGDSYKHLHPELNEQYNVFQLQMGITAEKVAEEYKVFREAQDKFAFRSYQRTVEATDSDCFGDEIVSIETIDGVVTEDKDICRDTSIGILGGLGPAFSGDGPITAGNSSQITGGAAAIPVTSREFAEGRGLDMLVSVGTNNVAGVDPTVTGIGPVPATHGLLGRTGTDIDDYGLVEISGTSAGQYEYLRRELGIDADSLNVNDGTIALGHPLGAFGAHLPVTLTHKMQKHDVDRDLASLCVGLGQSAAIEFSR